MGRPMTTDVELRERIARLEARAEILDCTQRYAWGMDRRDRPLLRSAYHDDAVNDHVGFVCPVEDFIDWAFAYHSTRTRYQHYLLNHTAEVNGDEAHAETYYLFVGTDREPADHMTLSGGRHVDRLERRDTDEVLALLIDIKSATHDRSDPSYTRPLTATRPSMNP
jgi:hypothetical protein